MFNPNSPKMQKLADLFGRLILAIAILLSLAFWGWIIVMAWRLFTSLLN